eukprot:comp24430_c0_seq1/m.46700 comp24430_c0_seq1/g.46700  ORF comp24430_c0_seq1/g.46700 comp24430_c0_seq1/m.46700 type:complete len:173 (-) comp24430_c0_seq1:272-790(-)
MPAYHSSYNNEKFELVGDMSLMPLNTTYRGPAPKGDGSPDIIDEAFSYFKANMFFQNFPIEGPADRVLIYVTLFIRECIVQAQSCATASDAKKRLNTFALANFSLPGDANFALGQLYKAPSSKQEGDLMRQYMTQLRVETADRFVQKAYVNDKPDKWWFCFGKRKFLNKTTD